MGVKITDLFKGEEIELDHLSGKTIAIDSFMFLYQFLTTIRQKDGSLLMDSKGQVTSHLTGLFNRTVKLMSIGVKLIFVFDGKAPELKKKERERRAALKEQAQKQYEVAKEREDLEQMKKYAARTTRLTPDMVEEAKKLIEALGCPIVQAPSEGEAQAAYIVQAGDAWGIATQDADALLFKAPRLIRNLSVAGKRKKANRLSYETINLEVIELKGVLDKLEINQDQLIALAMLVGTDYNLGGIKGIGQKNALKLIKQYKNDFDKLFKEVKWDESFDFPWQNVFNLINKMPIKKDYSLKWKPVDRKKVYEVLVENHDFTAERVNSTLDRLQDNKTKQQQKGLGEFF